MTKHLYDVGPFRIFVDTDVESVTRFTEGEGGPLPPAPVKVRKFGEKEPCGCSSDISTAILWCQIECRRLGIDRIVKEVPTPVFAGTSVICVHKGKVLAGVRGDACGHGRGFLSFPGGKLEQGTDTDTAIAGEREFLEEVGRPCQVDNNDRVSSPIVFTTNCLFEADQQHYVTLYLLAKPKWDVVEGEPIPGMEPTKCAEWRWWTLREIIAFLLGKPDWDPDALDWGDFYVKIDETIATLPHDKLQWMPVKELFFFQRQLGIKFYEKEQVLSRK